MEKNMFSNIKDSNNWVRIELLNKGWSKDIKYHILDKEDNEYLLRISDISLYDKKKKQFELLKEVEKLNINASIPIDFGILNDNKVYMLLTWLEGESAEEYVSSLSNEDAYKLGIEAGKTLKKVPNSSFLNQVLDLAKSKGIDLKPRSVYCTDSIICEYMHLDFIKSFDCDLIEMETAAFYRSLELIGKRGIALLVVSDNSTSGVSLISRTEEQTKIFHKSRETNIPQLLFGICTI